MDLPDHIEKLLFKLIRFMKIKIVFPALLMIFLSLAGVASSNNIDNVRKIIYLWSNAWQSRDIAHYMAFYSPVFRSKEDDFNSWEKRKADIFKKVGYIKVNISDLWIFIEGKQATATFIQKYQDSCISDTGEKKLILTGSRKKWKIISEEWKPVKIPLASFGGPLPSFSTLYSQREEKKNENISKNDKHKSLPPNKIIIKNIKYKLNKNNETVFISFNTFISPAVFSLEGERPRIVMDIKNVNSWNGPFKIPVKGKLIKRIRTYYYRKTGKLRIVLDLNPADNYAVDQISYRAENIYSIVIKEP